MVLCKLPVHGAVLLFCIFVSVLFPSSLYASGKSEKRRKAAETASPAKEPAVENRRTILAGTDEGLFAVDPAGKMTALWAGGSVKKILFTANDTWVILGSEGILISTNLQTWEPRNQGLPVKTIKIFQDGKKTFLPMVQEIKDLKINPADPQIMVCATKDQVYLSRNQGQSWTSLGAPPYRTNGIKAVASAYMPRGTSSDLTVFLSHSTYGLFYIQPDRAGAQWIELSKGLEKLETTGNADEVSDIAVILATMLGETTPRPVIYAAQTFRRRIYRLDWEAQTFNLMWSDNSPFGTVDSLYAGKNGLYFLYEGMAASLDFANFAVREQPQILDSIRKASAHIKSHCMVIPEDEQIILSELWLLDEPQHENTNNAANKEGIYLPVNHAMDSRSLKPYLDVMEKSGLNMIVIDMKDDYGRLRFTPHNPAISVKGRVFRPLDIDSLLGGMKERGIYTVARVVVFKDPELAAKENGRFAVWDAKTAQPWAGYDSEQKLYDERWVDPYSQDVWEYIAATAAELHERGFDEIQFDYIRFPTDGVNLGNARYRWQENGMDMESAILSFLRHIRARVKAPISIDIYGANGWYRTGARTGQEVELLAPWVDVICPMYYPSHFEQHFLAQDPPELRPWRIYFQGTLRTARIGRSQVIIRPYVQAFFLNVSYDRKYYNPDYVRRQIEGVRAAGSGGFIYWNNTGRYEDIPVK
ncbi:MAG: putative glycoside hydrolase [Treponema sp.]|jgi:hypothetical protein|nr:putative glycoside hydrolase [Treponema sp.]